MSDIIALYVDAAPDSPARRRIRRLSLPFEIVFGLLAGLTALFTLAVAMVALWPGLDAIWMGPDMVWLVLPGDTPAAGTVSFAGLPLMTQAVGGLAFIAVNLALFVAFVILMRLFACYRRGDVFGDLPQRLMQTAGVALVFFALAPGALQPLLRLAGSLDRGWFHGHSVAALIVGAALFVFARVVALGREVEREAGEFV